MSRTARVLGKARVSEGGYEESAERETDGEAELCARAQDGEAGDNTNPSESDPEKGREQGDETKQVVVLEEGATGAAIEDGEDQYKRGEALHHGG